MPLQCLFFSLAQNMVEIAIQILCPTSGQASNSKRAHLAVCRASAKVRLAAKQIQLTAWQVMSIHPTPIPPGISTRRKVLVFGPRRSAVLLGSRAASMLRRGGLRGASFQPIDHFSRPGLRLGSTENDWKTAICIESGYFFRGVPQIF